ncbi:unnamed protein product [Aureobasidium mustum]|uniref:BTB domain-containing protein n=1 Tax=Aureobasidium mustum TaxID=2773714 RepID=A0A9N8PMW4_9PEZI|nr:unnamed protein product [Aureobasidium mustum]
MSSNTTCMSTASISRNADFDTTVTSGTKSHKILRFSEYRYSCFDDVILHFDGISRLVSKHVLVQSSPIFATAFKDSSENDKPPQFTIEKYSKDAVFTLLHHIHDEGGYYSRLPRLWSKMPEESMIDAWGELRNYFEVFLMANEYGVESLRSQAQANIMAIRKRAWKLEDTLIVSTILNEVVNIYNNACDLDSSMLHELASQCLEHECKKERNHFWMFGKYDGIWAAEIKGFEKLVAKLNELDEGLVPKPWKSCVLPRSGTPPLVF